MPSRASQSINWIGNGAEVLASGSVLVEATDDTYADMISGSLGLGISAVGVSVSAGVGVVVKTTDAWIVDGASVTGLGNGDAIFIEGEAEGPRGVIVHAWSKEDLFNLGLSGAGGMYAGVGANVTVSVIDSDTSAWIGANAAINRGPGVPHYGQDVAESSQRTTPRRWGLPVGWPEESWAPWAEWTWAVSGSAEFRERGEG